MTTQLFCGCFVEVNVAVVDDIVVVVVDVVIVVVFVFVNVIIVTLLVVTDNIIFTCGQCSSEAHESYH